MKKNVKQRVYKILNDDARRLMCCSMFYSGWRKPNYRGYSSHVEMDIIHFVGMAGIYTIGNRDYKVEPGDIFVVRSNEKHRITEVHQAGMIENIMFDSIFLWKEDNYYGMNFLSAFKSDIDGFESKIDKDSNIYPIVLQMIRNIYSEFERKQFGYAQMVKMHMYTLLFNIARNNGFTKDDTELNDVQLNSIHKAIQYIDDHLCENMTIPLLAKKVNLSTNYFRILFKQVVGISPIKYINSKRIERAIGLLEKYRGNMLALALECGFNSTANFNRAFRMYTGQVPSKYLPVTL